MPKPHDLFTSVTKYGIFFLYVSACADIGPGDIVGDAALTSLSILPKHTILETNSTRAFSVTAEWTNGSTDIPKVSFSLIGEGEIDSSGVFTAPGATGTTYVIAQHTGGARADTARVDVTSSPPPPPPPTVPPPPPTTGDFTPNLPSGLNLITDSRFENLREEQYNSDGLAYAWDGRISSDPTAPFGTTVFENFYPANHRGNGEGGAILYGRDRQKWRRMYFSVMMWVPSNYSIHTNGEKFFYPVVTTNGQTTSSTSFGWYIVGGESASSATWTLGYENQIGDPRRFQTSSVKMRKGTWQRVEFYVVMNTPGQSNGIWRVWIDGVLAVDFTNARYSNASTQSVFDGIRFTGTRGGGASSVATPAGGQIRRYNRLVYYASEQ